MKKKVVKTFVVIMLLILVVFIVDLGRKTYIFYKCEMSSREYSKITNFYKKMNNNNMITEYWQKDDEAVTKISLNNGDVRSIYYGKENAWMIIDNKDEEGKETKIAVKIPIENALGRASLVGITGIENVWDAIKISVISIITTDNIGDVECYKIQIGNGYKTFINKENFMTMRIINGSTDTGNIEYKINEVTDKDVKLTDLTGYQIEEAK